MNRETVLKFKAIFEEQRRNLVYSGKFMNQEFEIKKDDLLDETDMTASEMEQAMRMRLRNREALLLRKIDEALLRIKEGTFGECDCCGEDIESRRLEARPTATLCIACKEEDERRESIHIDSRKPKSLGAKLRLA